MKFGVCIPHYGRKLDPDGLVEMAVRAEEMGFDSVWVTDHIIVPHEIPGRDDIVYRHDMLEPIAFLTHLGAVTKTVKIGTSVVILPYRNPVILAKAIATADVLSHGRVIFGAAIGWMEGEFAALNAPFEDRAEVSGEYLSLLKELWANPTPTFKGKHFEFSDVTFSPMPAQKPMPPVWIGGRSRRGVRRAVEFGDFWHPSQMGPTELAEKAAYMRRHCEKVGRATPPDLSFRGNLDLSASSGNGDRLPLQGTVEDVISDLEQYSEAGVSHAIMEVAGDAFSDKFRMMEHFASEVKPRFSD